MFLSKKQSPVCVPIHVSQKVTKFCKEKDRRNKGPQYVSNRRNLRSRNALWWNGPEWSKQKLLRDHILFYL